MKIAIQKPLAALISVLVLSAGAHAASSDGQSPDIVVFGGGKTGATAAPVNRDASGNIVVFGPGASGTAVYPNPTADIVVFGPGRSEAAAPVDRSNIVVFGAGSGAAANPADRSNIVVFGPGVASPADPSNIVVFKPGITPAALSKGDLIEFAQALLGNQLSEAQSDEFIGRLSADQRDYVLAAIQALKDGALEAQLTDRARNEKVGNTVMACDPAAAPACWKQGIQAEGGSNGGPRVSAVGWTRNLTVCDGNPDDNDYIFMFRINSMDPDRLRWQVVDDWALGGILKLRQDADGFSSHGYNNNEARVCMGDFTVFLAGGPEAIMRQLRLYNR
ncbi:hypothetical protein [Tahibacter amnicola]|uniref:Uncharacterized protein n=1 Tax=Tahibacter amnicola TaxID=2976241 RepID=A0ABY6BB98_9GAMM|nr:hypothetical protein [Tahibacter amnicola]UXI66811.1 hypothetical protein N4264_18935 [Tahibacter amnicola]